MRLRAVFSKHGAARYISHLDLQRTFERALRRAEIPVAYSQGFNPKPRFSLASALMLGAAGDNEVVDVHLEEYMEPSEFIRRMNSQLTEGLEFKKAKMLPDSAKDAQTLVSAARYRIKYRGLGKPLLEAARDFISARSVLAQKQTKDGVKQIDARRLVIAFRLLGDDEAEVLVDLSGPSIKPSDLAAIIAQGGDVSSVLPEGLSFDITRTDVLAKIADHYIPVYEL